MSQGFYSSLVAYVYDSNLRIEANERGQNYWYEYVKEVLDQLGVGARESLGVSLRTETS